MSKGKKQSRLSRLSAVERKKEVLSNLAGFGSSLYDQMDKGVFPWVKMPSRSIENIYYNPDVRQ